MQSTQSPFPRTENCITPMRIALELLVGAHPGAGTHVTNPQSGSILCDLTLSGAAAR
jgi:hypothetical protein